MFGKDGAVDLLLLHELFDFLFETRGQPYLALIRTQVR